MESLGGQAVSHLPLPKLIEVIKAQDREIRQQLTPLKAWVMARKGDGGWGAGGVPWPATKWSAMGENCLGCLQEGHNYLRRELV